MSSGGPTWETARPLEVGYYSPPTPVSGLTPGEEWPYNSAWWTITSETEVTVSIDSELSVPASVEYPYPDTVLIVYSGDSYDTAVQVDYDDDGGSIGGLSRTDFTMEAGVVYHVRLGTYSTEGSDVEALVLRISEYQYGDWAGGTPRAVPATQASSVSAMNSNAAAVGTTYSDSGPYGPEATNAILNSWRGTVDGQPSTVNPDYYGANFSAQISIELADTDSRWTSPYPYAIRVATCRSFAQGGYFEADTSTGWSSYNSEIQAAEPSWASGWDFENVPLTFDSASLTWQLHHQDANAYNRVGEGITGMHSGLHVDIYTSPGDSASVYPASPELRESRDIWVENDPQPDWTVERDGSSWQIDTPQPPLQLEFASTQLSSNRGGVHVWPSTSQIGIADWVTGGWSAFTMYGTSALMASELPDMEYVVTFPRYRYKGLLPTLLSPDPVIAGSMGPGGRRFARTVG